MNLEKIVLELLGRIQNTEERITSLEERFAKLEERVAKLEEGSQSGAPRERVFPSGVVGRKYLPLAEYLFENNGKKIVLTYAQIEHILGCELPATANDYPASFWANTATHSYSSAWMKIGYKARINIAEKKVTFEKSL